MPDASAIAMEWGECVWVTSDPDLVTARERSRALAEALGFSASDQASFETTISELAIKMLTYARSGEIRIEAVEKTGSAGLRIVADDWGSSTEALHIPELERLAEGFEVQRRAGRGTTVTLTKWLRTSKSSAA